MQTKHGSGDTNWRTKTAETFEKPSRSLLEVLDMVNDTSRKTCENLNLKPTWLLVEKPGTQNGNNLPWVWPLLQNLIQQLCWSLNINGIHSSWQSSATAMLFKPLRSPFGHPQFSRSSLRVAILPELAVEANWSMVILMVHPRFLTVPGTKTSHTPTHIFGTVSEESCF